jgi:hypothetical protein
MRALRTEQSLKYAQIEDVPKGIGDCCGHVATDMASKSGGLSLSELFDVEVSALFGVIEAQTGVGRELVAALPVSLWSFRPF